jgi:hypothetical protein
MLNSNPVDSRQAASSTRRDWGNWRRAAWPVACAALVSAWLLAPQAVHADTTIAGDLDFNVPVSSNYAQTGGGFGIRLGQQLHLPLISLNPEIGFAYASFAQRRSSLGVSGPTIYRGIAGLRLGVGEVLRFGLLAHVGYGYVSVDVPAAVKLDDPSHTAFTYDVGLFLDFTALPLLNIGLHAAYNRVSGKERLDPLNWMQLGAHAALVL